MLSNTAWAYTLQEDIAPGADDYVSIGYQGDRKHVANKFVPASSYTLTQLEVGLKLGSGTPLDSALHAYIATDNAGSPSDTMTEATNTLLTDLTAGCAYYAFQFAGYALTSGTTYWVVLELETVDAVDYPRWCLDTTAGTGVNKYTADPHSWTTNAGAPYKNTMKTYITEGGGGGTTTTTPLSVYTHEFNGVPLYQLEPWWTAVIFFLKTWYLWALLFGFAFVLGKIGRL